MDGWLKSDSMALGGPSRCAMRSRRKANDLAAEKLAQPYVSEEDVLAVLEQWYFSKKHDKDQRVPERNHVRGIRHLGPRAKQDRESGRDEHYEEVAGGVPALLPLASSAPAANL